MKQFIILIFLSLPLLAYAERFDVWPDSTIQNAVIRASDGDTILIHEGIYFETVVLYGKTLTLAGEFLLDGDTTHIGGTIISPDFMRVDTGSCVVYAYGESPEGRLVGLTLEAGTGTYWDHTEDFAGGALYAHLSGVTVENCIIQGSSAHRGGGIAAVNTDNAHRSRLQLLGTTVRNCFAETWGGGVFTAYCSLRVEQTTFEDDFSPLQGGGLSLGGCVVELDSCIFQRCASDWVGGLVAGSCVGWISNCVFRNNNGADMVNDLWIYDSWVPVRRCLFRSGSTQAHSIILLGTGDNAQHFYGNVLEGIQSLYVTGTMYASSGGGEIAYNIFHNNVNVTGGVLYVGDRSNVRVHHNVFDGNSSVYPNHGSAVRVVNRAAPFVDSNWVVNNVGPAMEIEEATIRHLDARNNWWGDASGPYHPTLNPEGRGDTLLQDSILFIPWLTAPPDTTMPPDFADRTRPEISSTWRLLEIYPNPFNSSIRIIIAGFAREDFRLTLHNLLGQEVDVIHSGALTGGELSYTAPPTLATGVYFLRAASRDNIQTRKVLFMK